MDDWTAMAECLRRPDLSWMVYDELYDEVQCRAVCKFECPVNVECADLGIGTGAIDSMWGGVVAGTAVWKRLRTVWVNERDQFPTAYLRAVELDGLPLGASR